MCTTYDGPRTDLTDETRVWLDASARPTTVRAPDGSVTRLERGDARFPALITRVVGATGLATSAVYDGAGHPLAVTVHNPLGDGRDATTRYTWDASLDAVTSIVSPEGVVTRYGVDSATAAPRWVEEGDASTRVTFERGPLGLVDAVRTPSGTSSDGSADVRGATNAATMSYDALGNVASVRLASGATVRHYRDAIGRDTLVLTPTGAADDAAWEAGALRNRVVYDAAGRVALEEVVGAAAAAPVGGAMQADTLRVRRRYDAEGNLDVLERVARPDRARTGSALRTTWTYDAFGRVTTERAPDGAADSLFYDAAGNVTRRVTRRGYAVRFAYDVMNRVVTRVLPEVREPAPRVDGWHFSADQHTDAERVAGAGRLAVPIAADTERFAYDALGRLLRAENGDAAISRRYLPGGALASDRVTVRLSDDPREVAATTVVRYAYDLDGRRTRVEASPRRAGLPNDSIDSGSNSPPDVVTFEYDGRGALGGVTDPLGARFRFEYDADGRMTRRVDPGGIAAVTVFDAAGDGALRATVRLPGDGGSEEVDTLRVIRTRYDARGRVTRSRTIDYTAAVRGDRIDDLAYSGLGMLAGRREITPGGVREERMDVDAFGQTLARSSAVDGGAPITTRYEYSLYDEGRLVDRWETNPGTTGRDHNAYDASGNVVARSRTTTEAEPRTGDATAVSSVLVNHYAADERVRVSEELTIRRRRPAGQMGEPSAAARVERVRRETRYDALGRRVFARVSRTTAPGDGRPSVAAAWRTLLVWDGDQLLATERTADSAPDGAPTFTATSTFYTPGPGTDDPLSIVRTRRTARGVERGAVVPHRDWRGAFDLALDTAGRRAADDAAVLAELADTSLVRAREFDAVQGRYLQEDPLGAERAASVYGTGGDPATYADPSGLCRVEVRYARLGAVLGKGFYHAYVVTTAPDLTRLFFRGGPSGDGPSGSVRQFGAAVLGVVGRALGLTVTSSSPGFGRGWGALETAWGRYEPGAADWDPAEPPTTRVVDDGAPCDGYVASFTRTLEAVANRRVSYNPFAANSNALVRELLAGAGLAPVRPLVWAPGWGATLLR